MNSKLIYSVSEFSKHKIVWTKVTANSEWIYFGEGNQLDERGILQAIQTHFTEDIFYIASTRHNSFEVDKTDLMDMMLKLLGLQKFLLWNLSFDKAIEFNSIGILRKGKVNK